MTSACNGRRRKSWVALSRSALESPFRPDCGQHDVSSREQLRNRGCGVWETLRVDHGRQWRPDMLTFGLASTR